MIRAIPLFFMLFFIFFPAGTRASGDGLRVLPRASLSVGGEWYLENDARYDYAVKRTLDLDLVRYRHFLLTMNVNEIITRRDQGDLHRPPGLIRYEMDYANLAWMFSPGMLSLYFDHICDNAINRNDTLPLQLRWYGAGLRWETYGMRPGHKDSGISRGGLFEWIGSLNYRLSASRKLSNRSFDYNFLFIAQARYDLLRFHFLVPYLEGTLYGIVDDRLRVNRGYEGGFRILLENVDIIPSFSYRYKYDIDVYHGGNAGFYFFGLRAETLLGGMEKGSVVKSGDDEAPSLFPGIHFSAGYGKFFVNKRLNYNTDILVDADVITVGGFTPFVKSRLVHNSLVENAGMFPRYMQGTFESGVSYGLPLLRSILEPFYRFRRYDESNFSNGFSESFHGAGLRLVSPAMKTGRSGAGLSGDGGAGLQGVNRLSWSLSSQRLFHEEYYRYRWEHEAALRWDIFRVKNTVSYMAGTAVLSTGERRLMDLTGEVGTRFSFPVEVTLYYQFRHLSAEDRGNGLYRRHHLLGLRMSRDPVFFKVRFRHGHESHQGLGHHLLTVALQGIDLGLRYDDPFAPAHDPGAADEGVSARGLEIVDLELDGEDSGFRRDRGEGGVARRVVRHGGDEPRVDKAVLLQVLFNDLHPGLEFSVSNGDGPEAAEMYESLGEIIS